jgi:hypothetical protein
VVLRDGLEVIMKEKNCVAAENGTPVFQPVAYTTLAELSRRQKGRQKKIGHTLFVFLNDAVISYG